MSGYALTYLALISRDVDAVCRFLGGSLGLARKDLSLDGRAIPFFGIGAAALVGRKIQSTGFVLWREDEPIAFVPHLDPAPGWLLLLEVLLRSCISVKATY